MLERPPVSSTAQMHQLVYTKDNLPTYGESMFMREAAKHISPVIDFLKLCADNKVTTLLAEVKTYLEERCTDESVSEDTLISEGEDILTKLNTASQKVLPESSKLITEEKFQADCGSKLTEKSPQKLLDTRDLYLKNIRDVHALIAELRKAPSEINEILTALKPAPTTPAPTAPTMGKK